MAAESGYGDFIAQLERKRPVEPSGRDSYVDVFNQAARLIGHLKKGLSTSIKRERQSEVRVAAQSWQESCYNDRPGSGIDILDWQPRYSKLDSSDGTSDSGCGPRNAAGASTAGPQRRNASSPPGRRNLSGGGSTCDGNSAIVIASVSGSGVEPIASDQPVAADQHPHTRPRAPAPTAAGSSELQPPAADRAASESHAAPMRQGWGHQPQPPRLQVPEHDPFQDGGGVDPVGHILAPTPGREFRVRRATDGMLAPPRRYGPQGNERSPRAAAEEELAAAEGEQTEAAGSNERLHTPGGVPPRLPPLEEPAAQLLNTVAHAPSRADEAIRIFARTAYEPGERRHSLFVLTSMDGSEGSPGADPHHLHPLAPVPRSVPKKVTDALAALLPSGLRSTSPAPSSLIFAEGGSVGGRAGSRDMSPSLVAPRQTSYTSGVRPTWQGPLYTQRRPHPPAAPPDDTSRPAALRGRLAASSFTGPSPYAAGPTAAGSAPALLVPAPLGPDGEGTRALLLPRPVHRPGGSEYWESDSPNSPSFKFSTRSQRSPSGSRAPGGSASGRMRHSISGLLPASAQAPAGRSGSREAPASIPGGSPGAPPGPHRGMSLTGEAALSPGGGGGGGKGGGLIRGYAGGGPLDHRILDLVPRLTMDAPRLKGLATGATAAATAAAAATTAAAAAAAAAAESHVEIRRGLLAAPAGLAANLNPAQPATPGGGGGGEVPSPSAPSGRFCGSRRTSCTGMTSPPGGVMSALNLRAVSHSSTSSGMMVTREQIDSYVAAQAPGGGPSRAAVGSARPAHNTIGRRGSLVEEPKLLPISPEALRLLRREVVVTDESGIRGVLGV